MDTDDIMHPEPRDEFGERYWSSTKPDMEGILEAPKKLCLGTVVFLVTFAAKMIRFKQFTNGYESIRDFLRLHNTERFGRTYRLPEPFPLEIETVHLSIVTWLNNRPFRIRRADDPNVLRARVALREQESKLFVMRLAQMRLEQDLLRRGTPRNQEELRRYVAEEAYIQLDTTAEYEE